MPVYSARPSSACLNVHKLNVHNVLKLTYIFSKRKF